MGTNHRQSWQTVPALTKLRIPVCGAALREAVRDTKASSFPPIDVSQLKGSARDVEPSIHPGFTRSMVSGLRDPSRP